MNTLEQAQLSNSMRHIARFLKSGILIYDSEVPDRPGRKARIRTQAIAKRFVFHINAIRQRKTGADISTKIEKFLQKEV